MANYVSTMARTADATLAVGSIIAGATPRRGTVYELTMGSEATAADNPFLWTMDRCTTQGTSSAVTPSVTDQADTVAANAVAGQNFTINPTVSTLLMMRLPLNQRATFRWVAQPGKEFIWPATQNNGFIWKTPTSTAVAISLTVTHSE